jgi:putative PIN family toxin of toxin-antitoxin system
VIELVPIMQRIELCRDPRDDKFLELALAGRADFLLTGDADLLALRQFHGTAILTPAAYLAHA